MRFRNIGLFAILIIISWINLQAVSFADLINPDDQTEEFVFRNARTGTLKCMDVETDAEHHVVMKDCNPVTNTGQIFHKIQTNIQDRIAIKSRYPGKDYCMDVSPNKYVVMKPCSGANSGQYFHTNLLGGPGHVNFLSDYTGNDFCMDIADNGRNVVMKKCLDDKRFSYISQVFAPIILQPSNLDNSYFFLQMLKDTPV
jgi:hypothetical protein